jgi:hypothetical protein
MRDDVGVLRRVLTGDPPDGGVGLAITAGLVGDEYQV